MTEVTINGKEYFSEHLCEATAKELRKGVDAKTRARQKKLPYTHFMGVNKKGELFFETHSGTHPDTSLHWMQRVKLLDLPDIADDESLSDYEKTKYALDGDIKVTCTCPAHLYWGSAWRLDQINTELELIGVEEPTHNTVINTLLCKHLDLVLQVIKFNTRTIQKVLDKAGLLDPETELN